MSQNKWYASSTGEGVSLTFKGIAVALIPIIVSTARFYDIEVTESDLIEFINAAFAAISGCMIVYGLGRKIYYKLAKRKEY